MAFRLHGTRGADEALVAEARLETAIHLAKWRHTPAR